MQTIQLQISDDNIAKKVLSFLDKFIDKGIKITKINRLESDLKVNEFENDIQQAFKELKENKGIKTGKSVKLAI